MQKKKRKKKQGCGDFGVMQVVRALLAAKELTTIISQQCTKKDTTRRLWGRGRWMKMIMRAVLTNTKRRRMPN